MFCVSGFCAGDPLTTLLESFRFALAATPSTLQARTKCHQLLLLLALLPLCLQLDFQLGDATATAAWSCCCNVSKATHAALLACDELPTENAAWIVTLEDYLYALQDWYDKSHPTRDHPGARQRSMPGDGATPMPSGPATALPPSALARAGAVVGALGVEDASNGSGASGNGSNVSSGRDEACGLGLTLASANLPPYMLGRHLLKVGWTRHCTSASVYSMCVGCP